MDRLQIGLWQLTMRGRKCAEALRKNGFDAHFLPDRDAVRDRVLAECEGADSIGFGGSMSIAEMKIHEALSGKGKRLLDHGRVPQAEKAAAREELARRIKQLVEAGDYRVSRPSEALERLEAVLARTHVLATRVPAELAAALSVAARQAGRPVGHLVREAMAYYLAAAAAHAAAQRAPGPPPAGADAPAGTASAEEAFFGKKMG